MAAAAFSPALGKLGLQAQQAAVQWEKMPDVGCTFAMVGAKCSFKESGCKRTSRPALKTQGKQQAQPQEKV